MLNQICQLQIALISTVLGAAASGVPALAAPGHSHQMGMPAWLRIPVVIAFGMLGGFVTLCYAADRDGSTIAEKVRAPIGVGTMILSGAVALFTGQLLPPFIRWVGGNQASIDSALGVAFFLGLFSLPIASAVGNKIGKGDVTNPLGKPAKSKGQRAK